MNENGDQVHSEVKIPRYTNLEVLQTEQDSDGDIK